MDWSYQRPLLVPMLTTVLNLARRLEDESARQAVEKMADRRRCYRIPTHEQLIDLKNGLLTSPNAEDYMHILRTGLDEIGYSIEGF